MLRKKELKKQRADDLPQVQWSLKVKLVVEKNKWNQLILFFNDCLSIWIALIWLIVYNYLLCARNEMPT